MPKKILKSNFDRKRLTHNGASGIMRRSIMTKYIQNPERRLRPASYAGIRSLGDCGTGGVVKQ